MVICMLRAVEVLLGRPVKLRIGQVCPVSLYFDGTFATFWTHRPQVHRGERPRQNHERVDNLVQVGEFLVGCLCSTTLCDGALQARHVRATEHSRLSLLNGALATVHAKSRLCSACPDDEALILCVSLHPELPLQVLHPQQQLTNEVSTSSRKESSLAANNTYPLQPNTRCLPLSYTQSRPLFFCTLACPRPETPLYLTPTIKSVSHTPSVNPSLARPVPIPSS